MFLILLRYNKALVLIMTLCHLGGEMQDNTYWRLIQAGIYLFNNNDFNAVSTRQITSHAEANLSAISYCFGGKKELYIQVCDYLIEEVNKKLKGFDLDAFKRLKLTAKEERLTEILINFQELFVGEIGVSRFNIFNRELNSRANPQITQKIQTLFKLVYSNCFKRLTRRERRSLLIVNKERNNDVRN